MRVIDVSRAELLRAVYTLARGEASVLANTIRRLVSDEGRPLQLGSGAPSSAEKPIALAQPSQPTVGVR